MTMAHPRRRRRPPPAPLLLLVASLISTTCTARRGAIVRDGMSSKTSYENPFLYAGTGDIAGDPDVVAITTRCSKWSFDPVDFCGDDDETSKAAMGLLSKEMLSTPLHVTLRSKTLGANGRRPNWMRATATLGDPAKRRSWSLPWGASSAPVAVRAVWTVSNADADTSMTFDEANAKSGRQVKKEIGGDVLEDKYEDCLKRLYGKYVELEVLLPRAGGGPPPSLVYRVPIREGHVNPLGMVSKGRATATLYPGGRTLAAAKASGPGAKDVPRDLAVPLGLAGVHLPLGPGLVDPGWAKGKKLFWRGRSAGLV